MSAAAHRMAVLAIAAALAAPVAAAAEPGPSGGPAEATAAKGKHKKKRKKRKQRPPTTQPTVPGVPSQNPTEPGPDPEPEPEPPCAGDDPAEHDDDEAHATVVTWPGEMSLRYERFICPDDPDFFKVVLPPGKFLLFSIYPAPGFDAAFTRYVNGVDLGTTNQYPPGTIEWAQYSNTSSAAVVFSVAVRGATAAATGSYYVLGYDT